MPSHGKLVVPDGLKTLLEALGRAVVQDQPDNIQIFASSYFIELLQFREGLYPAFIYFVVEQMY